MFALSRSGLVTKLASPVIRLCLLVGLISPAAPLVTDASAAVHGKAHTVELTTSDGLVRSYRIFVPSSYDSSAPVALVLVFHGALGTSKQMAELTDFEVIAEREGFIVVFPQSTSLPESDFFTSWNVGINFGETTVEDVDDIAFVDQVLDSLQTTYAIDPARIFATGFSNGGMFTNRLACERADRFAAFAPVAGSIAIADCDPGRAVPVLAFHGTDDRIVDYRGGDLIGSNGSLPSADEMIASWAALNGCNLTPITARQDNLIQTRYLECTNQVTVQLNSVVNLGHNWPGGEWFGSSGVNATELIWEFFEGSS